MPNSLFYFAYGRLHEHEGFQFVVDAGDRTPADADLSAMAKGFGDPGDAAVAVTADPMVPADVDLGRAVVFLLDGVLHLSRPQRDLHRFGRLTEGIVVDADAPDPARHRPLRLLGAFSRTACIDEVTRTRSELDSRVRAAGSSRPLGGLLTPGYPHAEGIRQLLARALAAFAGRDPAGHLAIVLSPEQAHLAVPLAIGLDEILPPADKQRGFAFATFPVEAPNPALRERLGWTLFVSRASSVPGAAVCDLRNPPAEDDPVAGAAEMLLARGAGTVETFARWLAERLAGPLSKLPTEFWQRLNLRLVTGGELGRMPAGVMANLLDWRVLDLNGFLGFWNAVGSDGSAEAVRAQTIERIARWASSCPPVLGWLFHPDVLNDETAPAVAKALEEAFARLPGSQTR